MSQKDGNGTYGTLTGTALAATTGTAWYLTTLLLGVCGSLCRSYIPVISLEGSIQLYIMIAHPCQARRCMGRFTYC